MFSLSQKKTNKNCEVAENSFDPSDYSSSKEVDKGLAITHEQVSDTFTEGTIDAEIDNLEREEKKFPKK